MALSFYPLSRYAIAGRFMTFKNSLIGCPKEERNARWLLLYSALFTWVFTDRWRTKLYLDSLKWEFFAGGKNNIKRLIPFIPPFQIKEMAYLFELPFVCSVGNWFAPGVQGYFRCMIVYRDELFLGGSWSCVLVSESNFIWSGSLKDIRQLFFMIITLLLALSELFFVRTKISHVLYERRLFIESIWYDGYLFAFPIVVSFLYASHKF